MGISKVPGSRHSIFSKKSHNKKGKATERGKHASVDKPSTQKVGFKSRSDNTSLIKGIASSRTAREGILPPKVIKPGHSCFTGNFSLNMKDALTGDVFMNIAKRSFQKNRPYCFAVAIAGSNSSTEKKEIFMDGPEYLSGIYEESVKMPHQMKLKSGEEVMFIDVNFFVVREDNSIERLASADEAVSGENKMVLRSIVLQEENEIYERTGNITSILIASAYHLGIGVNVDKEYARYIMPKMNSAQKQEAAPDAFGLVLMCQESARLVKFLLDNGFDPRVKDPNDEITSIQMAIDEGDKEVLRLFEKYGYWKNE